MRCVWFIRRYFDETFLPSRADSPSPGSGLPERATGTQVTRGGFGACCGARGGAPPWRSQVRVHDARHATWRRTGRHRRARTQRRHHSCQDTMLARSFVLPDAFSHDDKTRVQQLTQLAIEPGRKLAAFRAAHQDKRT